MWPAIPPDGSCLHHTPAALQVFSCQVFTAWDMADVMELPRMKFITSLCVTDIFVSGDATQYLLESLSRMPQLQCLELRRGNIADSIATALVTFIERTNGAATSFDFHWPLALNTLVLEVSQYFGQWTWVHRHSRGTWDDKKTDSVFEALALAQSMTNAVVTHAGHDRTWKRSL